MKGKYIFTLGFCCELSAIAICILIFVLFHRVPAYVVFYIPLEEAVKTVTTPLKSVINGQVLNVGAWIVVVFTNCLKWVLPIWLFYRRNVVLGSAIVVVLIATVLYTIAVRDFNGL
jgi:hypothetical protein